jgi:adenylyl-sulfate kinase
MNAWTVWLTGLPASGKSTLARALRARLRERGENAVILDSDEVRAVLTPRPTYTPAERDRFYTALVGLAALLNRYGTNVIIAATAPRQGYRDLARTLLAPFAEIWVRCPLETCRARDPKGLYARAAIGEVDSLPGAGAPYEEPEAAEVIIDSDRNSIQDSISFLLERLPWLVDVPVESRAR